MILRTLDEARALVASDPGVRAVYEYLDLPSGKTLYRVERYHDRGRTLGIATSFCPRLVYVKDPRFQHLAAGVWFV